jgi:hypothetical protein
VCVADVERGRNKIQRGQMKVRDKEPSELPVTRDKEPKKNGIELSKSGLIFLIR